VAPSQCLPDLQTRLAGEMDALRRCREWLERLDRGEMVVVNLRPETDPETEYVSFDRPRVLRVLARIIADHDELAGFPAIAAEEQAEVDDPEARRARHRRRLAAPDPPSKRLSAREERRPYGPLRACHLTSEGEPDCGNRDEAFPVTGRSRKRSVK
jgi:hypothetical protein